MHYSNYNHSIETLIYILQLQTIFNRATNRVRGRLISASLLITAAGGGRRHCHSLHFWSVKIIINASSSTQTAGKN